MMTHIWIRQWIRRECNVTFDARTICATARMKSPRNDSMRQMHFRHSTNTYNARHTVVQLYILIFNRSVVDVCMCNVHCYTHTRYIWKCKTVAHNKRSKIGFLTQSTEKRSVRLQHNGATGQLHSAHCCRLHHIQHAIDGICTIHIVDLAVHCVMLCCAVRSILIQRAELTTKEMSAPYTLILSLARKFLPVVDNVVAAVVVHTSPQHYTQIYIRILSFTAYRCIAVLCASYTCNCFRARDLDENKTGENSMTCGHATVPVYLFLSPLSFLFASSSSFPFIAFFIFLFVSVFYFHVVFKEKQHSNQ